MKEIEYDGNIYLLPKGTKDAAIVTTNGMIRCDGEAVMGAGIAKYSRDTFPGVSKMLGNYLEETGNHVYYLGAQIIPKPPFSDTFLLFSFPTKEHWKDNSKLELIRQSCQEIMKLVSKQEVNNIYMPCPGCGYGKLDYWNNVRPILSEELDDRFVVCIPKRIMKERKNEL